MKESIPLPRIEGTASRQAHADLPAGTYERELGREGFYGSATHMYHTHPPMGWIDSDRPLRPRCSDLNRLISGSNSPWDRSDEHSATIQTLMRISSPVCCFQKQT